MKKAILVVGILILSVKAAAQVKIAAGDTTAAYLRSFVRAITGPGVPVYNIKYTGSPQALGMFSDATGAVGLKKGVILTTGNVISAEGPNTSSGPFSTNLGWPGSAVLAVASGAQGASDTHDGATIEFDVKPLGKNISIRFVYGSEEYNKLLTGAGDIFLISITGPGLPVNGKNIATLPSTNISISAKNINNGPADFGTAPSGPCTNCSYFVYNAPNGAITGYNSYTKVVTATAAVSTCATYHVAIAIGDIADPYGDSGVFIEQGNFGGSGLLSTVPLSANGSVEICENDPLPVFYTVNTIAGMGWHWYINDTLTSVVVNSITGSSVGEYKITGTMPSTLGGCTWSDSLFFNIGESFTLTSAGVRVCSSDSVALSATPDKAGNYTYHWQPDSLFYNSGAVSPKVFPSRDTKYKVDVRNSSGCHVQDSVLVTVNPLLYDVPLGANATTVCGGQTVTLLSGIVVTSVAGATGADNYEVRWYSPLGERIGTGSTLLYPATLPGVYVDSLISEHGCVASDTFRLAMQNLVLKTSADTSVCKGAALVLTATGAVTYRWESSSVPLSSTSGLNLPSVLSALHIKVLGTGAAPLFCSVADSVEVAVFPPINITSTHDTTVCQLKPLKIFATGATIAWDAGIVFSSDSIEWPLQNTQYRFTATDTHHCSIKDTISVQVWVPAAVSVSGISQVCKGQPLVLSVSGGSLYQWTGPGLAQNTTAGINILAQQGGLYKATVTDAHGCQSADSLWVNVNAPAAVLPFISAKRGTVCPEQEIKDTLSGVSGYVYIWSPGLLINRVITVDSVGWYKLVIVNTEGCTAADSLYISEYCPLPPGTRPDSIFFIPNVFTPNGDGINDRFEIVGMDGQAQLLVYNRWGKQVFVSENYANEWAGEGFPDGLYYYSLQIVSSGKHYNGWVEIVR